MDDGVGPSLLLRHWQDSQHPHAARLASSAAAVLEGRVAQLNGKIGCATGPVVADLLTRRLAADLTAVGWLADAGLDVRATRTSGGTAMIAAWLPFSSRPREHGARLCADFRSMIRDRPQDPWVLRLGVEVEANDLRTAAQARAAAHDLAMPMLTALTCTALQQTMRQEEQEDLAAALRPRRRTDDGLRRGPDDLALSAWRKSALTSERSGSHPVLFHDNLRTGIRLASLVEVDVARLDRHQLLQLLITALSYLDNAGRR